MNERYFEEYQIVHNFVAEIIKIVVNCYGKIFCNTLN